MTAPINVNDDAFENEVIKSDLPVLVDFWAEWCGPCKIIAPTVRKIAQDYDSKLKVVKVNVDENVESSLKYNVRSIPTLILFKGGNPVGQVVGAVGESELVKLVKTGL